MTETTCAVGNEVAVLSATNCRKLAHLSDADLLHATRRLTAASNQLLAALLEHLAEVEARGVHRAKACASLYTYCVYELRFSEDAAYRRVAAARLVQKFPALFDAVASGELTLTGLLQIGPHLNDENLLQVLARAKHRTKKELAKLVRELAPLPDAPACIEPLGPSAQLPASPRNPTWAEYMASLAPVRHLREGERPRDWMSNNPLADADEQPPPSRQVRSALPQEPTLEGSRQPEPSLEDARQPEPQRYRVQFTADEEHIQLLARAQALLGDSTPLPKLYLEAMRQLVAQLEKRERKQNLSSRQEPGSLDVRAPFQGRAESEKGTAKLADPERDMGTAELADPEPDMGTAELADGESVTTNLSVNAETNVPRQRGRYISVAIRRAVRQRDEYRCTFVSDDGRRCCEVSRLEFHHIKPFVLLREHTVEGITLRCRAHNAFAAEEDFGREQILSKRDGTRHEAFTRQRGD